MVCTSALPVILVSLLFQRQFVFHLIFFSCVLYYIKLHYITLTNYLVYASLLSLLQLFFCLHVRLLYAIKYYLLTYLLTYFVPLFTVSATFAVPCSTFVLHFCFSLT